MKFLASRPELDTGALELARAYAALSTCRQIGMGGLGPIPVTAIWQWQDRNGIADPRLRRHIESVISAVDASALKRANRPQAQPAAESKVDERFATKSRRRR